MSNFFPFLPSKETYCFIKVPPSKKKYLEDLNKALSAEKLKACLGRVKSEKNIEEGVSKNFHCNIAALTLLIQTNNLLNMLGIKTLTGDLLNLPSSATLL